MLFCSRLRGHRSGRLHAVLLAAMLFVLEAMSASAFAQGRARRRTRDEVQSYSVQVRSGDTLASIGRRFGLSASDLASSNSMNAQAALREGTSLTIPGYAVWTVQNGQTLSAIASRSGCAVREIQRLNRMGERNTLRPGQNLILRYAGNVETGERDATTSIRGRASEGPAPRHVAESGGRWGRARNPGTVRLLLPNERREHRVRIFDRRGRFQRASVRSMLGIMRPKPGRYIGRRRPTRWPNPDTRLLGVLARISDHFGGRPIRLVSGLRPVGGYTRETSRHVAGNAMDIRIEGVANTELRDFARTLDRVGVGYYPRSHFVHVDVRDRANYWVDWSRPGEAPQYERDGLAGGSLEAGGHSHGVAPQATENAADAQAEAESDALDQGAVGQESIDDAEPD